MNQPTKAPPPETQKMLAEMDERFRKDRIQMVVFIIAVTAFYSGILSIIWTLTQ